MAAPPAPSVILVGLIDHVGQNKERQSGGRERLTVPAKPSTLVNVMLDFPVAPTATITGLGLADMVKSGRSCAVATLVTEESARTNDARTRNL